MTEATWRTGRPSATTTASGSTGPASSPGPGRGLRGAGRVKAALDPDGILNPGKLGLASPVRPGALAMSGTGSILVVDVGTSGVRAAIVRPDATVEHIHHVPVLPDTPAPGLVEFDAAPMADAVLEVATAAPGRRGPGGRPWGSPTSGRRPSSGTAPPGGRSAPASAGRTCAPSAPASSLQAEGIRLAPNASATKVAAILDAVDPDRARAERGELCFGTVDTLGGLDALGGRRWRRLHVTDATNAGVTGSRSTPTVGWDEPSCCETLRHPRRRCCPRSSTRRGRSAPPAPLPGAPPICGIAGDQQASLIGQGCTRPGWPRPPSAPAGMLDQCTGRAGAGRQSGRGRGRHHPDHRLAAGGPLTWGVEAVMLSAGTCVEWLRDDLGVIDDAGGVGRGGGAVRDTGDVWFVPGPAGARARRCGTSGPGGPSSGLTRGAGRPELVRAVLEGVAHRGADLVEAAEPTAASRSTRCGSTAACPANEVFVQALADAIGRPVEISPVLEATTLGAGLPGRAGHRHLRIDRRHRGDVLAQADGRAPDRRRHPIPFP